MEGEHDYLNISYNIKMKEIILASNNKNKLKELKKELSKFGINVISQKEAGFDFEVEENGKTFKENAEIKARAVYNLTNKPTIADDSGLCVDYLNGEPGIYSHRFAGENATDDDRIDKLLKMLEGVETSKRGCHYTCAVCFIDKDGKSHFWEEYLNGTIGFDKKGTNGFGFDPIVVLEDGRHVAELSMNEKNKISHRGKAFREFTKSIEHF